MPVVLQTLRDVDVDPATVAGVRERLPRDGAVTIQSVATALHACHVAGRHMRLMWRHLDSPTRPSAPAASESTDGGQRASTAEVTVSVMLSRIGRSS